MARKANVSDLTHAELQELGESNEHVNADIICSNFLRQYKPGWTRDMVDDACLEILVNQRPRERFSATLRRLGLGAGVTAGYVEVAEWRRFKSGGKIGKAE